MAVQVQELDCLEGTLGVITLDSPGTVNSLSGDMVRDLQTALDRWADSPHICLVLICASGERGFSAGSDVKELYQALLDAPEDGHSADGIARLLAPEYRMNYALHGFPKPVIALAQGAVMGGGMGLLQACRYRLILPDTRLAVPEVTLGMFPDAGASWFLNRLPEGLGLFLGLTGAQLNASDALRIGLVDLVLQPGQKDTLIDTLCQQRWSGDTAADDNRLYRLLNQQKQTRPDHLPASELECYEQKISRLCRDDELPVIVDRLLASREDNAPWWNESISRLKTACPVSLWLVDELLRRGQQMALKDLLRMELVMAAECGRRPDLKEGIRARMIDRDEQPVWSFSNVRDVPRDLVLTHFESPWSDTGHPLATLGRPPGQ